MSSPAPRDLTRLPIGFDLRAISLEEGLRAGLSVAALVAANELLHWPLLLEAGLGALLTCLCDGGGAISRRVPALLSFALAGAALITGFGLLRPLGPVIIPLAALGIFGFSLLRIYGPTAQQVGNVLNVVLVLSLDHAFTHAAPALRLAFSFMAGSIWALLLTMVIWRLHPNRPSRQAVADIFVALAALCADLRGLTAAANPAAEQDWERHARAHRRAVRERIERARAIIADSLHAGVAGSPAARTLLRLESADQLFAVIVALTELLESTPDAPTRTHAASLAARLEALLRQFAPHIVTDTQAGEAALAAAIAQIATVADHLPTGALQRLALLLVERLRVTLNITTPAQAGLGPLPAAPAMSDRLLAPLRDNLDLRSAALRHAARAAVIAAAGLAITFAWPGRYQHWLTITLVLTLQPYYALTLQRALERIGGTVLGGLIAAALALICHTPVQIAAAILPLVVLCFALRAVNFGLTVTCLTPVVVLLVELAAPSDSHLAIAAMRALYAIIGGALAVAGCVLLWPSWEPDRLDQELTIAVRSHGRYTALELALLQNEATLAQVDAARRDAGMASNNLEASLSRALLEPRRPARLDAVLVIDAALRRMAGRVSAMQIDPALHGEPAIAAWRDWVAIAAETLIQPLPPPLPPRPDLAPQDPILADSVTRIARQFELLAGALRRYREPPLSPDLAIAPIPRRMGEQSETHHAGPHAPPPQSTTTRPDPPV